MNKRKEYEKSLIPLWSDPAALEACLIARSNLPGPRANREVMAAFADLAGERGAEAGPLLERFAAVDVDQAPTDNPREALPCCAAQGFGAVCAAAPDFQARALKALRLLASDPHLGAKTKPVEETACSVARPR